MTTFADKFDFKYVGNYFVDIFPFMMYIPTWMAKWKREGYAWFKKDTDMFVGLVEDVKAGLVSVSFP